MRSPMTQDEIDAWYDRFYDIPRDLIVGALLAALLAWLTIFHSKFWTKRLDGWSVYPHVSEAVLVVYFTVGALLTIAMLYGSGTTSASQTPCSARN